MIKKNKKGKMTINQLAVLMKTGFSSVNKKIGHLQEFIEEQIDKLAISTAKGFESADKRFNKVDERFESMEKRFENIEKTMATKIDIEGLKNKIEGVNNRIDDLAINRVKYSEHNALVKRVEKLEKV